MDTDESPPAAVQGLRLLPDVEAGDETAVPTTRHPRQTEPPSAVNNRAQRNNDYAQNAELELRDRATVGKGFKAWLEYVADDESYADLIDAVKACKTLPLQFHYEPWVRELTTSDDDDLNVRLEEQLTKARLEWSVDMLAREKTNKVLDIDTTSMFDFRDMTQGKVLKCRYVPSGGTVCGKPVIPGTVRCRHHGGELVDSTTRRAVLLTSYLQLVEASAAAVDCLVTVATTGRNELARVAAAKEILDRAGLTTELQVSVRMDTDGQKERLNDLVGRLDTMQRGLTTRVVEAVGREVATTRAEHTYSPDQSEEPLND